MKSMGLASIIYLASNAALCKKKVSSLKVESLQLFQPTDKGDAYGVGAELCSSIPYGECQFFARHKRFEAANPSEASFYTKP